MPLYSGAAAAKLNGCLVTVSSYKRDYLTLSKVNGKGASTALNLSPVPVAQAYAKALEWTDALFAGVPA